MLRHMKHFDSKHTVYMRAECQLNNQNLSEIIMSSILITLLPLTASLDWLKNHLEPEGVITEKWNETFSLRREKLNQCILLEDYFTLIPSLKQQFGKTLVS